MKSISQTDRTIWLKRGWQPTAIGFVPSEEAWKQTHKDYDFAEGAVWPDVKPGGGRCVWLKHTTTGENIILVVIGAPTKAYKDSVTLSIVHEAVHVWQFLCEAMGEEKPGIEMEAYGIQHIVQELLLAYQQTYKKKKRS